ncbi:MAG: hypothetical protein CBD27_04455 [Rhodospirillaceae bacterium TMED167]|nr:hypothetical protein [Rhodospirillaceae bacterium]OUW28563.1 MAG: hypothetical protein CBD27_04455 [Rhodospirillaceae bacterium TMED167]
MQRGEFQKANFPYHWIGATFLQAKLVFAQRRGVLEIRFERNFSYQIESFEEKGPSNDNDYKNQLQYKITR